MKFERLRCLLPAPVVLVLGMILSAGCSSTEPTTVLQFPPGTKPQEPIKIDPRKAQTGGGVSSEGDPSDYTKVPGSP